MHVNWRKVILVVMDVILGVYLIIAFTAFNKPDETAKVCTKVSIDIQDESSNGFIDTKEIKNRLERKHIYPLGKPMAFVNPREIEDALKSTAFVKTAECYKTQDGHVCISLTQRMPVVRVKSVYGEEYYVDDKNNIMPNTHYVSDLIIATGYIRQYFARNYIAPLAQDIMNSEFWSNQIEQINILPNHGVELVPRVGNHVVYMGIMPESKYKTERERLIKAFVETKLTRLGKFYKYGLSKAGWNKYSYINMEFDNQIICKKALSD